VPGRAEDLALERRGEVTVVERRQVAWDKSAALLGCAVALGALPSGGDRGQCQALRRFGGHLGIAFQLADDLLGIWGNPAKTGKPVFAGLALRKKSLPVVAALAGLIEAAGGRGWADLVSLAGMVTGCGH
jgi:geranylgeranyl diphosphate synthase type I